MSENQNIKTFSLVSITMFLAILILPSLLWAVVKLLPGKPINVLDFDLGENRNVASFPTEFTSTYGLDLEAFYNDRLPFRSVIISANRGLTAATEKIYDEKISPLLVKIFYSKPSADGTMVVDYMPPKVHNNNTIQGRDGWLFLAIEGALEDYLGSNIMTEEEMAEYLALMKRVQDLCTAQGKEIYFLIPPEKAQIYPEKMPSYTILDDYRRVERLVDYIRENSDIKISYPIEELLAAKDRFQLYYKADTHWNESGAFFGVQALYSLMGLPTTELQDYHIVEDQFAGGDLIAMGNLSPEDYTPDINYNVEYKMDVPVTVLDNTAAEQEIYKTSSLAEIDRNFLVIGDSYRLFMSKYFIRDFTGYSHIHRDALLKEECKTLIQNADIIVIESVERYNNLIPQSLTILCEYLEQQ